MSKKEMKETIRKCEMEFKKIEWFLYGAIFGTCLMLVIDFIMDLI